MHHQPPKKSDSATRQPNCTRHIEALRQALELDIDEVTNRERVSALRSEQARRHQRLTEEGYSDDDIDRMEDMRNLCEFELLRTLAESSRVYIDRGTVRVVGSQAELFAKRLMQFNQPHPDHSHSYAAAVLTRLLEGTP